MQPSPFPPVPEQTAAVARAAFRRAPLPERLRDELGVLYEDADFAALFPARGQPALPPWRLAFVTVLQFLEGLSDRQAADAVRARIEQTTERHGFRRFGLRGLTQVGAEWDLICLTHNVLKLFRAGACVARLAPA